MFETFRVFRSIVTRIHAMQQNKRADASLHGLYLEPDNNSLEKFRVFQVVAKFHTVVQVAPLECFNELPRTLLVSFYRNTEVSCMCLGYYELKVAIDSNYFPLIF